MDSEEGDQVRNRRWQSLGHGSQNLLPNNKILVLLSPFAGNHALQLLLVNGRKSTTHKPNPRSLLTLPSLYVPSTTRDIMSAAEFENPVGVKIIDTEPQRFFAIVGHGPFDTCGPKFEELSKIAKKEGLFESETNKMAMLVLCNVPTTEKPDLVWACGIRVESGKEMPEGLEEIIVPGRKCATAIHKGGYEGLPKSWGNLCMKWIPSQNLCPAKGSRECPHFEVYLNSCATGTKTEDLETQLFCPVEEKE